MKKIHTMTAAAALFALIAAAPAFAESSSATDSKNVTATSKASNAMKRGWDETKEAVSNTTGGIKEKMSTDVIKASLLPSDSSAKVAPISIDKNMTASGIIGKPVYNQKNERVATVADVILDSEGHANMIVVKDSSFMGLGGKLAAFDYDAVIDRTKEGDVVMPITQKTIDNVAEFSYKPAEKSTVRAIPEHGVSVKKLLGSNLVDPAGKKIATVDNITLRDGRANLVIAAYNKILGMGGDKVAFDFDTTQIVRDKDDVDLKLSADQTQKLESFKASNK